jgi:hypothetical protein
MDDKLFLIFLGTTDYTNHPDEFGGERSEVRPPFLVAALLVFCGRSHSSSGQRTEVAWVNAHASPEARATLSRGSL